MNPDEIREAYQVLTDQVKDNMATNAATIGNSQRSVGNLASKVASPTGQTSGLANYTYNRLLRPTLNTSTAALTVNGKSQALSKYLGDQLRAAKERYEDAQNKYTVASTTPSTVTTGSNGDSGIDEYEVPSYTSNTTAVTAIPYGTINGVQYYYNPDTGHVVVDGVEYDMTPDQYADWVKYEGPTSNFGQKVQNMAAAGSDSKSIQRATVDQLEATGKLSKEMADQVRKNLGL